MKCPTKIGILTYVGLIIIKKPFEWFKMKCNDYWLFVDFYSYNILSLSKRKFANNFWKCAKGTQDLVSVPVLDPNPFVQGHNLIFDLQFCCPEDYLFVFCLVKVVH